MPSLLKPLGLLFWSKFNFNSMSCIFAYSAGQSLLCVALLLQIRLIIQYGLPVVKWEGENFSCRWELLVYYQNIFYDYDNLGHISEWRKEKDSKAMYHLKIARRWKHYASCTLCEFLSWSFFSRGWFILQNYHIQEILVIFHRWGE